MKKSKRSGTATKDSEKAERALSPYKFLSWLDNFVYIREGKTNLKVDEVNDNSDENDESDEVDSNYGENEEHTIADKNNVPMETVLSLEPLKRKVPSTKKTKRNKQAKKSSDNAKDSYLQDMEISVIKSLKDDLSKGSENKKEKELDSVDLFVHSLGADLKKLGEREYFMAQNEIRGVVFKYQMARFVREPLMTPPLADYLCSPNNQSLNFGNQRMEGFNRSYTSPTN